MMATSAGCSAARSWAAWRVLLITIVGEELTEDERAVFNSLTGRAAGSLLGWRSDT